MALPNAYECESAWHVPARLRLELLALLSADPTQTATMTYEEFLQWPSQPRRSRCGTLASRRCL